MQNLNSMDMLSILPDDVICGILSFLPTKSSVRTSILSKRWRCLWSRVPALEFTCDHYPTERVDSKIIGKVMLQHKLKINTFRLNYQKIGLTDYELESWIENVAARNVRNIVIRLYYQTKLPQCLFTCKTLVSLTLIRSGVIPVDGSVDFPALKKLELVHVYFDYHESLPRLLFGCPVLEELFIQISGSLNICSPTVTKLTVHSCNSRHWIEPCKVKLDAPALRYLRLSACTYENYFAGTLASLNEVDVDFFHCPEGRDDEFHDDEEIEIMALCYSSILEFLDKMCNVRSLKLSLSLLMISDEMLSEFAPKFHNLSDLELSGDCRFVPIFLENANSLRLLKIGSISGCWRDPKQVPACLISHLETVNLVDFWWFAEHDLDMIKYILKYGKVLKRVRITTLYRSRELDVMKTCRLRNILASFVRVSQMCQVSLD